MKSFILIFFFFISTAISSPYASAQNVEEVPEHIKTESQNIASEVMSPYCPGRTLSACPSTDALKLRNQITTMLLEGYSREAVKRQLFAMFGDEIRGVPKVQGIGIVAWGMPVFLCVLGITLLMMYLRYSRHKKNFVKTSLEYPIGIKKEIEEILNKSHKNSEDSE